MISAPLVYLKNSSFGIKPILLSLKRYLIVKNFFTTMINSVGVKIQEISHQGVKGIKMANFIEYYSSAFPKEPIFL